MSGFLGSLIGAISSAISSVVDPFFNYVALLLNGDGTNGTQNNTFLDSSPNNFAITRTGTPTQGTASPFSQTGWSGYFNGSSGLNAPSSSDFTLGTGDFTIEAFAFFSSTTAGTIIDMRTGTTSVSPVLYLNSGPITLFVAGTNVITGPTPSANVWHHIALVRASNVTRLYLDAVQVGTSYTDNNNYIINSPFIGYGYGSANYTTGYLSNLRVVKGVALYSGTNTSTPNFSIPTAALTAVSGTVLLTLQSNRFVDANTQTTQKNLTLTGTPSIQSFSPFAPTATNIINPTWWGGSFNGTTDYLSVTATSQYAFGTGDWSVDFFVYPLAYGGSTAGAQLFGTTNGSQGGYSINLGENIDRFRVISTASGAWTDTFTAGTGNGPPLNAWTHMAVCRVGANISIFKNGTRVATSAAAATWNFTGTTGLIGLFSDGINIRYLNGYLSNLRVNKGSSVYDPTQTTITVPTSNVTGSANTTLLTLQNSTFVDNSASPNTITANGRVNTQNISPFASTGWSGYFDGNLDYLTLSSAISFAADFTVEGWFFQTGSYTTGAYSEVFTNVGSSTQLYFDRTSTGLVGFYNGTFIESAAGVFLRNQWNHVAWVRASGTVTIYVNGKCVATGSASSATSIQRIGSDTGGYEFRGNISNVRIISNQSLYTGSTVGTTYFTPSTSPLTRTTVGSTGSGAATSITGTVNLLTLQSNYFVDNSASPLTFTLTGTPTIVDSSPFPYTVSNAVVGPVGGSGYFGGSDWIYTPATTAATNGIALLAGNLSTQEFYFYQGSVTTQYSVFGNFAGVAVNGRQAIWLTSSAKVQFAYSTSTSSLSSVTTTASIIANAWNHVAITINATTASSSTIVIYINGVGQTFTGIDLSSHTTNPGIAFAIAGDSGSSASNYAAYVGYIGYARILRGALAYTGNFTPPTAPLQASGPLSAASYPSTTNVNIAFPASQCSLLTNFTNAGIVDATSKNDLVTVGSAQISTAVTKFGTGSMKFNGTTDYLSFPASQNMSLGSGDFTIEGWVYISAITAYGTIVGTRPTAGNYTDAWTLGIHATGYIYFYTNAFIVQSATGLITTGQWYYIAATRSGTTLKVFLNGSQVGSTATNSQSLTQNILYVGANLDASDKLNGYIDDLRITKGVARTITTPTQAFPVQ